MQQAAQRTPNVQYESVTVDKNTLWKRAIDSLNKAAEKDCNGELEVAVQHYLDAGSYLIEARKGNDTMSVS